MIERGLRPRVVSGAAPPEVFTGLRAHLR